MTNCRSASGTRIRNGKSERADPDQLHRLGREISHNDSAKVPRGADTSRTDSAACTFDSGTTLATPPAT